MLSELLVAGVITTIMGGLKDRADIRRGKANANEYFRRTNAEREAIERRTMNEWKKYLQDTQKKIKNVLLNKLKGKCKNDRVGFGFPPGIFYTAKLIIRE